jgi:hypothetical protein
MTILKLPEDRSNRLLSDVGTSWGALSLLISSALSTSLFLLHPFLNIIISNLFIFFLSQLICCLSLFITYWRQDFWAAFSILPLTGLAMATFNSIPESILELMEQEKNKRGEFKKLIRISLFLGEICMFCGLPLIMNLLPEVDEMVDTIGVGASMAGVSCVIAFFVWMRGRDGRIL